ncbi:MAG: TIGR01777 family oxidoreductase [Janthinobacterium lividum]
MNAVFAILSVQALIGAFDNLWHHELEAKLPQHISARYELVLHASREAIYAVLFLGLAWVRWEGAWAWVLAGLLAVEIIITLADFIEEDLTRRLPKLERVLHTILAVSYGAFVAALAPEMLRWATVPTGLPAVDHGWVSWLFTLYAAGVLAWSVRNWIAVAKLYRAARTALPDVVVPPAHGPAVLVTGGTGFIGSAFVRSLADEGTRVIVLTRDARRAAATFGPRVLALESLDAIPSETPVAAIVNLAGASILGGRWTARRKAVLLASRIETTRALHTLAERLETRPRVLVSASAVGFYGDRPDGAELDETAPPQPGQFQSDLCATWEGQAKTLRRLGMRVVTMRFGGVLGREGGLYPALALAARFRMGAIFGTGQQAMPWVHLDDAVAALRLAMAQDSLEGAVNVVAPELVSQAVFARSIAGPRAFCPRLPAALIAAVGGEAATLLLGGQAAPPRRLLAAGFRFAHPTLASAVAALSAPPATAPRTSPRAGSAAAGSNLQRPQRMLG